MSIIYEPTGKAREYSPLAANFYNGCDHGCAYCYAPGIRRMERKDFNIVSARNNIVDLFRKDAIKNYGCKKQVLFNFMGDPYCKKNDTDKITRECLKISAENRIPVAVLTKGGKRCLQDIDVFKKFGEHIMIGATLTFFDSEKSNKWEPGAASPQERLDTLKFIHENGIKTFASFEPVIEPSESILLIQKSIDFIDEYKIGKLNNYMGIDKKINWTVFLNDVVFILRKNNKSFYIKNDLAENAPSIILSEKERNADYHTIAPW